MRVVKRSELLRLGSVLYAELKDMEFPEQLCIKYDEGIGNDFVEEPFPITYPDIEGCTNYHQTLETVFDNKDQSYCISELETCREGTFSDLDKEYWVYEDDDIRSMIGKLQSLLPK